MLQLQNENSSEYSSKYMNQENQLIFIKFYLKYRQIYSIRHLKLMKDEIKIINIMIKRYYCVIENVHYLMLDELKDVPKTVSIILDQMAEFGLLFCGDKVQNIEKGIGFTFF
ncbi:unnamed protein product [Paramecium sonneborni]|uniref:Uncharacterized protein n=1 Tax=Paramecium sonneborni TaxID=65129 RepID=A0A8S1PIH1_9CILI|nr:unnamed protein product [Paramecium sonneborni]